MGTSPPRLTDLTMPLHEGIAAFPAHGRSVISLSPVMRHAEFAGTGRVNNYDGAGISFAITQWLLGDQAGTHMDAPWHADASSEITTERIPIDYGFGPAVWLDCTEALVAGAITTEILERARDAARVAIEPGDIVLLRTGSSDTAVSDPTAYASRAVGLTRSAAEMLRETGLKTVGVDCVTVESPDTAASADVHTNFLRPTTLGRDPSDVVAIIENLVGIDRIPNHACTLAAFPLPLVGAAGGPLRAVAVTPRLTVPDVP